MSRLTPQITRVTALSRGTVPGHHADGTGLSTGRAAPDRREGRQPRQLCSALTDSPRVTSVYALSRDLPSAVLRRISFVAPVEAIRQRVRPIESTMTLFWLF
ncbi:hypothetical protein GOODEAATRI_025307 [Goodea atripinnis]|uniref:Uncharacterized protein n=1 Tax=Goodea atripinnis TaxID=208336 RepID=A0ABV0MX20_9TELE